MMSMEKGYAFFATEDPDRFDRYKVAIVAEQIDRVQIEWLPGEAKRIGADRVWLALGMVKRGVRGRTPTYPPSYDRRAAWNDRNPDYKYSENVKKAKRRYRNADPLAAWRSGDRRGFAWQQDNEGDWLKYRVTILEVDELNQSALIAWNTDRPIGSPDNQLIDLDLLHSGTRGTNKYPPRLNKLQSESNNDHDTIKVDRT